MQDGQDGDEEGGGRGTCNTPRRLRPPMPTLDMELIGTGSTLAYIFIDITMITSSESVLAT